MTEGESRGDRISRRAILASLPVSALAGGFAAGGIAGALTAGTTPAVVVGGPVTSTPAPLADPRPSTDATTSGILGDGVTDNAKALNALIAAAPAGQDILLPSGEYLVSGRLSLRSGVNLVGSGVGVTTIRLVDGADAPFVLVLGQSGLRISGITFDGGSQDQQEVALQLDSCTDVVVEDCAFVRMSHAVHVYRTGLDPSGGIVLRGNHFSEITDFAIRVTEGVESVLIENNVVTDVAKGAAPTPAAIYVRGTDVTVAGNTVLASDDTAVLVSGS
ncbi:MAG: glycosyl hydrolase family 28-related protein, partial [Herbiconiux sp.]|nr:glycosyl hydrolase family 28-related protein [Herbiconiux sp.]